MILIRHPIFLWLKKNINIEYFTKSGLLQLLNDWCEINFLYNSQVQGLNFKVLSEVLTRKIGNGLLRSVK